MPQKKKIVLPLSCVSYPSKGLYVVAIFVVLFCRYRHFLFCRYRRRFVLSLSSPVFSRRYRRRFVLSLSSSLCFLCPSAFVVVVVVFRFPFFCMFHHLFSGLSASCSTSFSFSFIFFFRHRYQLFCRDRFLRRSSIVVIVLAIVAHYCRRFGDHMNFHPLLCPSLSV